MPALNTSVKPSREEIVATLFPAETPYSKANILLVDDREDKLLALEAALSDLNQHIVKATSGREALRELLHRDFAVILLDVSMPGMDGYETAALIRQRTQSEYTPIIFVTSASRAENEITRGYSLGAVDYILSPIIPEILRSKVGVFVELYRKTEEVRRQSEQLRRIEEAFLKKQLTEAKDMLELETRRNRFFTLAVDMLAIASYDGYFLQLNPTWEKVLGFSREELTARPILEFVHPEHRESTAETVKKLKEEGGTTYFENCFFHSNGSVRWLGWTAAAFNSEKLIYLFARDITETKDRMEQLTEVNKELESFSYTISHDLRAPLRSMQGFAQALSEEHGEKLDADGQEFVRRILGSSKYMDVLLNDLLEYSRISRSQIGLTKVALEPLLDEILVQLKKDLDERKANVEIARPLSSVMAHAPTLRQSLSNLISNALKFVSPGQQPHICISTEQRNNRTRIWIEDNGIGISEEYHARIFNLFERLHNSREFPGTGVGLAIVRKAVERMGGGVGVESKVKKGSRFWIELPTA
jgi:PAS domain S-box-containing protein